MNQMRERRREEDRRREKERRREREREREREKERGGEREGEREAEREGERRRERIKQNILWPKARVSVTSSLDTTDSLHPVWERQRATRRGCQTRQERNRCRSKQSTSLWGTWPAI